MPRLVNRFRNIFFRIILLDFFLFNVFEKLSPIWYIFGCFFFVDHFVRGQSKIERSEYIHIFKFSLKNHIKTNRLIRFSYFWVV